MAHFLDARGDEKQISKLEWSKVVFFSLIYKVYKSPWRLRKWKNTCSCFIIFLLCNIFELSRWYIIHIQCIYICFFSIQKRPSKIIRLLCMCYSHSWGFEYKQGRDALWCRLERYTYTVGDRQIQWPYVFSVERKTSLILLSGTSLWLSLL